MNRFLLDLKFNLRLLRKTPLFSSICFLVIVIGMTVALCIYSIVYEITKRPPSFENGERFVSVRLIHQDPSKQNQIPALNDFAFQYLNSKINSFDLMGSFDFGRAVLQQEDSAIPVKIASITPNLSAATQSPIIGRTLDTSDDNPSHNTGILLSESMWRQYYNQAKNIIGETCQINGKLYTIVGVVEDQPHYLGVSDFYRPSRISNTEGPEGRSGNPILARLAPGISRQQAEQEFHALYLQLTQEYPNDYQDLNIQIRPFSSLTINMTPPNSGLDEGLKIVQWISISIFLLVSINLASLLFLRASNRQQELVLRNALGSNLWGVSKQILLESFILCSFGALTALLLSSFIVQSVDTLFEKVLSAISLSRVPVDMGLNVNMVVMCFGLMILLWILSAAMTVYRLLSKGLASNLNDSAKGSTDRSNMLLTKSIVGIEVILCCFLLTVCGVLSVAVFQVFNVDLGAHLDNRYSGRIEFNTVDYPTDIQRQDFLQQLHTELLNNPQIKSVTGSTSLPGVEAKWTPYALEDRDLRRGSLNPIQMRISIDNNYLHELNIPLVEGRYFDSGDTINSLPVAIVSEVFAQYAWPEESAIGKRIQINTPGPSVANIITSGKPQWLTIVGVSKHVVHATPLRGAQNWRSFYRPLSQFFPSTYYPIIRTHNSLSARQVETLFRDAISKVDKNAVIHNVDTLTNFATRDSVQLQFLGNTCLALGLGALLLSFIAIFGVVSRSVLLRTAEIGIRRALGSKRSQIITLFVKQGSYFLLIGAAVGLVSAVFASQLMSMLFTNLLQIVPWVALTVLVVVGFIIFLASWLPARQATSLEPGEALRHQ